MPHTHTLSLCLRGWLFAGSIFVSLIAVKAIYDRDGIACDVSPHGICTVSLSLNVKLPSAMLCCDRWHLTYWRWKLPITTSTATNRWLRINFFFGRRAKDIMRALKHLMHTSGSFFLPEERFRTCAQHMLVQLSAPLSFLSFFSSSSSSLSSLPLQKCARAMYCIGVFERSEHLLGSSDCHGQVSAVYTIQGSLKRKKRVFIGTDYCPPVNVVSVSPFCLFLFCGCEC